MAELNSWDIAAANNNDAPPDGWPESTMQYSEVNNTAREGMAVMARYFQDINGTLQFAGPVNAYTVTMNANHLAYFQGMYLVAEVNVTSTAAVTINVNSLGAKTATDQGGNALGAGDLQAGGIYEFRYDGTNFQLLGSIGGGDVIINNAQLRTDIVTATPPTTEAVTGNYDIFDADGSDQLASVGFNGSNALFVKNFMRAGVAAMQATNAAGTPVNVAVGDPDGRFEGYESGVSVMRTAAAASGGLEANNTLTASGYERVVTVTEHNLKAPTASPAFTGNPTAPTAAVNDNDTSIATTAFVVAQIADDAPTKTGGNASGNWGIDITGHADSVNLADESVDSIMYVAMANDPTGTQALKTGTNIVFNAASGGLFCTSFNGLLVGNGASVTAINATNISTGTLAVARGGTGATATTGSGSNVLGTSPTFLTQITTPLIQLNSTDSTMSRASAGNIEIEGRPLISHSDGALPSGRITVSTAGPSGGANGDIWLEREA